MSLTSKCRSCGIYTVSNGTRPLGFCEPCYIDVRIRRSSVELGLEQATDILCTCGARVALHDSLRVSTGMTFQRMCRDCATVQKCDHATLSFDHEGAIGPLPDGYSVAWCSSCSSEVFRMGDSEFYEILTWPKVARAWEREGDG